MKTLALVIGNANYVDQRNKLDNAVNDSTSISNAFRRLGVNVIECNDCTIEEFEQAVNQFKENAPEYTVGIFYYAGHGFQIKGNNYLSSVEAKFENESYAKRFSVELNEIIDAMEDAKLRVKIIILDTCRDNPFQGQARSVYFMGLAPVRAPQGTLIAFSTSPGETASDKGGGSNSIYTKALLTYIYIENLHIEEFFKRVRETVFDLSMGQQTSWEHTSLIGSFYFNSGQLTHSQSLPYSSMAIQDDSFESSGDTVDQIIEGLKSHDYYVQGPAVDKLSRIPISMFDDNKLFILGRNILQAAEGGEFKSIEIIKSLSSWLTKYTIKGENHVLNGILFEIYFNSKGDFRKYRFKSQYLDDIFKLETNQIYSSSFKFIRDTLNNFRDQLVYIPSVPPISVSLVLMFEETDNRLAGIVSVAYQLVSVKHESNELLPFSTLTDDDLVYLTYGEVKTKLKKEFCIPTNRLILCPNIEFEDKTKILAPWSFASK